MFECGQPLHAFDYDKLRENRIVVRRGRAGEEMVSIDETTCKLDPEMLLIADAARPVAVAGVMGGLDTEVSDSSGNILLESAFFDPASIRRTSRRLGLPSDSCYRFERRVDPATVEWASRRAAGLIVELAGGKLARGVVDANYMDIEPWEVVLRIPRVETVLGIPVPKAEACRILEALQLEVVEDEGDSIRVRVPVFRADLTREIDLIEEVARIHGYDRIPVETRATVRFTVRDDELKVGDQLRSVLSGLGYSEALTNCFMDNSEPHRLNPWKAGEPAELMNPVSSEKTHLRRSLMPGLLQAVRLNQNRTEEPVSLFELGTVYLPGLGGDKWRTDRPGEEQRPLEKLALGLVTGQEDGVAHMKGTLGVVCERLHVRERLSYAASDLQCFDDGMGIEARIGGQVLAVLGPVGSKWRQSLDLNGSPTVAELDADLLVRAADLSTTFEHLPSFPAVNRDLAVVLDESVEWASVEACVRRSATDLLEALEFMSEYRGEQIAAGKKSLAFSLSFRSSERTLTSEEVDEVQKSILAALESELGAKLR